MKVPLLLFILLTVITSSFSQGTEKFAKKVADNMCRCMGAINNLESLKQKLDSCYAKTINDAASHANSEELKIISNTDDFNKVKQSIGLLIQSDCESVKKLTQQQTKPAAATKPYPINFDNNEFQKAKQNPAAFNGKIVAFDGEIVEVKYLSRSKPYLKVKINNQFIWVGSMINSSYDKVGNVVRFIGYFSLTDKSSDEDLGFHILAFGEIDHKTKTLAFAPGFETQINEWEAGQVPEGK